MTHYDLWPRPYWLHQFEPPLMRLSEDLKKAVVFLGTGEEDGFTPVGTGFLVFYDNAQYLVTARHVAEGLVEFPFSMRINRLDGQSDTIHVDFADPEVRESQYRWYRHDDATVDLAVMPMNVSFHEAGLDIRHIPPSYFSWTNDGRHLGIGDISYAVGLFSRFHGKQRNIPIVHTGHIASLGDGERVSVNKGNSADRNAETESDVYLVELANLPGLSGAPVFFRPTVTVELPRIDGVDLPNGIVAPSDELSLLGVWLGSWDGYGEATDRAQGMRVPVGMGLVTPVAKLRELLDSELVTHEREAFRTKIAANSIAQPDGA